MLPLWVTGSAALGCRLYLLARSPFKVKKTQPKKEKKTQPTLIWTKGVSLSLTTTGQRWAAWAGAGPPMPPGTQALLAFLPPSSAWRHLLSSSLLCGYKRAATPQTAHLPMLWHEEGREQRAKWGMLAHSVSFSSGKQKIFPKPKNINITTYISFVRAVATPGRRRPMGRGLGLESRLASPQRPTVLSPALATTVLPHLSAGRERLGADPRYAAGYCSFRPGPLP